MGQPLVLLLLSGFLIGTGHVFAGPDHLAAIAPLAADQRRRTWVMGIIWGLGHSCGVLLLAGFSLALREALAVTSVTDWSAAISGWSERLVGVVLILLGILGLRRALAAHVHSHHHRHEGVDHVHIHVHETRIKHEHSEWHVHNHSAFGIGTLHGLAGASHWLGIFPSLGLSSWTSVTAYVTGFGLGTVAAMGAFSWIIGLLVMRFERRGNLAYQAIVALSCTAAIVVGLIWLLHGGQA